MTKREKESIFYLKCLHHTKYSSINLKHVCSEQEFTVIAMAIQMYRVILRYISFNQDILNGLHSLGH